MYLLLHHLLKWTYLLLPPITLVIALVQARWRKRAEPLAVLVLTCGSAIFIGAGVTLASASLLGGHLQTDEILSIWYFIFGMLCLLKLLRWIIDRILLRLLLGSQAAGEQRRKARGFRAGFARLVGSALLVVIGIPLIIGALIARRIHTSPVTDPQAALDWDYTPVQFTSSDGTALAGWWVPADTKPDQLSAAQAASWGHRTMLLCQGVAEDRDREMALIWLFASDGYNVLAIDTRGQGGSEGDWGSFGARERFDVLGAVRWITTAHPNQAQTIFGMGVGTGGAALIAAATDSSPEGLEWGGKIKALAVAGTFANFGDAVSQSLSAHMPKAVTWIARRLVLPFASAHAGADLEHFSPGQLVDQFWPRPILVIHGYADQSVPFGQGIDLFNSASQPKQFLWVNGDHTSVLSSSKTARKLCDFFARAQGLPVI